MQAESSTYIHSNGMYYEYDLFTEIGTVEWSLVDVGRLRFDI